MLHELRKLLKEARNRIKKRLKSSSTDNPELGGGSEKISPEGRLKSLKLLLLKLDFYFDWVTKEMANLQLYALPRIGLEAERIAERKLTTEKSPA